MAVEVYDENNKEKKGGTMKRISLFFLLLFILAIQCYCASQLLVDFGSDSGSTTFGSDYPDWNQVLRHAAYTQFVDPDGNPDHQGLSETASIPDAMTAFFGIKGATPINFQVGQKIVATFYNSSSSAITFSARVSLDDEDSPADTLPSWYTMYGGPDGYYEITIAGQSMGALEFYSTDSTMIAHKDAIPAQGQHSLININIAEGVNRNLLILTKIEISDEVDITPPTPPVNLQAQNYIVSQEAGNSAIRLTWEPASDTGAYAMGVSRYLIYKNDSLLDLLPADQVLAQGGHLEWIDICLAPNREYTYTVTTMDKAPFGSYPSVLGILNIRQGNESAKTAQAIITTPAWSSETLINPYQDLEYLGGFRLPNANGTSEWAYAGSGLAYYPDGNPGYDAASEWPGSLYGFGKNTVAHISEITIPKPVVSDNVADMSYARTLQPFVNLWPAVYNGNIYHSSGDGIATGLGFHPAANGVGAMLYYGLCGAYSGLLDAPGHGAFDLDLTQATGAWFVGGMPPNNIYAGLTAKCVFDAPSKWADSVTGGRSLIVSNSYISASRSRSYGPALFAMAPWERGSLPANGDSVTAVELVRYSVEGSQVLNYSGGEMSDGGAWLSANSRAAIGISHRRTTGEAWYGQPAGHYNYRNDLPAWTGGNKGYCTTQWKSGLMMYNPRDLERVTDNEKQSHEIQPYLIFDFMPHIFQGLVGDVTYDRANNHLYAIITNGDPGYQYGRSMVQVWKVAPGTAQAAPHRAPKQDEIELSVWPNPFSMGALITAGLPNTGNQSPNLEVRIFDLHGRLVQSFDQVRTANNSQRSSINWDASRHPSGVYIIKLKVGGTVLSRRAILFK
ncbi:MAG: hypothetical protein A2487_20255 [Candidatus Raymondbacteria bacterium RifOxyC12_full_50_8]|nr:MAG: hypothetical protein A2487_20255 [Candidatus Raymondbacteria bacterium RifOxyC12_full_50_8]